MAADKVQALSSMSNRQKATAGIVVVVVLILLWQLSSMFGGGGSAPQPVAPKVTPAKMAATGLTGPAASAPGMQAPNEPVTVDVMQGPPQTEREAMLMKLQAETQEKYLAAINELQVLKVSKEIAVTNKDISTAKLAKVVAEKKIYDLLTPAAPPPVSQSINNVAPVSAAIGPITNDQEVKYTVVSVSQLQYKWTAVMGYKGVIYNVRVGDVLPPDGSTVISIQRDGVTLEKDGNKTKVSLLSA